MTFSAPTLVFVGITGMFLMLLLVKELLPAEIKQRFCVLCSSVFVVWVALLILLRIGFFQNPILIALLIGQTTIGLFYLIEHALENKYKRYLLFRLPIYLTLTLIAYLIINPREVAGAVVVAGGVWTLLGLVYLYQQIPRLNTFVNKVVECCKRW
ncbi:hypothetical protein HZB01_04685 [Candidatus Woesearchaeota archaeon]|nr:hypothetical protein [Candidatus Woesearchaeota archaeon]